MLKNYVNCMFTQRRKEKSKDRKGVELSLSDFEIASYLYRARARASIRSLLLNALPVANLLSQTRQTQIHLLNLKTVALRIRLRQKRLILCQSILKLSHVIQRRRYKEMSNGEVRFRFKKPSVLFY